MFHEDPYFWDDTKILKEKLEHDSNSKSRAPHWYQQLNFSIRTLREKSCQQWPQGWQLNALYLICTFYVRKTFCEAVNRLCIQYILLSSYRKLKLTRLCIFLNIKKLLKMEISRALYPTRNWKYIKNIVLRERQKEINCK